MVSKKNQNLDVYAKKRDLKKTKEPSPKIPKRKKGYLEFVIQKHAARRLHYDFRLEVDGVLKSWAVPKGPSLDPQIKRLAMQVEDHPFDYKDFEGIIPEGYGAGTVIVWDRGVYSIPGLSVEKIEEKMREGLEGGELHLFLEGEKLKGEFVLVKLRKETNEWLFFKVKDPFVSKEDITKQDHSILTGRTIEEIGGPDIAKVTLKKAPTRKKPHHIKPMLATLIDAPFDSQEWLFELKMDGFRAIAELNFSEVELYSRNLKSFNRDFPFLIEELKNLKLDAIFDGEIVALDEKGISSFQLLQNRMSGSEKRIFYYVFDLLFLDGKDLKNVPLIERKMLLKDLLKKQKRVLYLDHIETNGVAFLRLSASKGCEGILGKMKQSLYQFGVRTKKWIKIKTYQRQEAIICGFTEPKKGRKNLGALILGIYRNGNLQFAGHVGGGFTEKKLQEVKAMLLPFVQKECPFQRKPATNTRATWVQPKFLCEVRFSEWTKDGLMRQPIFLGVREDKPLKEAWMEKPLKTKQIVGLRTSKKYDFLTHLDKLYWPKEKISKGAVVGYYAAMAPFILPYLKDRPQSLKRYPEGINGENFFQKNLEIAPDWLQTIPIEHHEKRVNYLLIQNVKSLLYAVNLGCIEIHTWLSRYQNLDKPEFFVLDLDPENIEFDAVVQTALAIRRILNLVGVTSVCKTSGATGLHICVPLKGKYSYEQVKQFCLIIGSHIQREIPSIVSMERSPKKRQKKVYIDCLQNNPGQTIVAPYSLRARPGAPVSTPLEWQEIEKGIDPLDFNFFNILDRVKKKGDLFLQVRQKPIDMRSALAKLENIL